LYNPNLTSLYSGPNGVIAVAAIVAADAAGNISVEANQSTDFIIDINGYFAAPGGSGALLFYPLPPCRVVDTRAYQNFPAPFGAPSLQAGVGRNFPVSSSRCGIPS